ncbi:MAG: hypothetical protein QW315_05970 [Candidatus Hadarchaeum sp.]
MEEKVKKLTDSDNVEEIAREYISRAFDEFNRWHNPEALAKLTKLDENLIVAELSGPFCRTCGLYDYFDDLKIELEKVVGKPLEILELDSDGDEHYRITYKVGDAHGG